MRRPVVALSASAVIAVAVVAVVIVVGVIPLPDFESLERSRDPSIPGTVAYFSGRGEERCLYTVRASGGAPRRVTCRIDGEPAYSSGQMAWTGDGHLAFEQYREPGPTVMVIDAATGATVDRVPTEQPGPDTRFQKVFVDRTRRSDGAVVGTGSPQTRVATVTVRSGPATREILRARGPRDYGFHDAQWSPDGRWILVRDSESRLIVLDESGRARVLAHDADAMPAWYIPGNATYTLDPAKLRSVAGA